MTLPEMPATVVTLANRVRVLVMPQPWLQSVSLSVFIRSGSQHESKRLNGISHVAEHMAFKGTATRDCQRINLDAERLGAEVNAHTDKDHTAFHMNGLPQHAQALLGMLGDIVCAGSYPEAELERERQVILQEFAEDEDDPLSTAYKLFDRNCWGSHPAAQAVIGTRANIERFSRQDLLDHVRRQYSGCNVIVAVTGPVEAEPMVAAAEAAFGALPAGTDNTVEPATWIGGHKTRRHAGSSQSHVVLGFPIATLREDEPAPVVAAALFGEGMSSPLMDELRERRGLVYYAACSADQLVCSGQFVVEASLAPQHLDEFFAETARLLRRQAETITPVDLERARNQIAVRTVRALERPYQRLESAAQDLFVHGRLRPRSEWLARVHAVNADTLRQTFARMLAAPPALAVVGKLATGAEQRFLERLAA